MKLSTCLNSTSYRPQLVLGVSRLSSLEYLKFRNPDLNEDQILSRIKEEGQDPQEILTEHQEQISCEQNLAAVLKKLDISFRITKRIGDATKCVKWADLVIPIGGDGTFLLASKLISDNKKPVLGINPLVSDKNTYFTLPYKYTTNMESIFEKLHSGEYELLMRSRIRTVMTGEGLYCRPFHIHEKGRTKGEKRSQSLIRSKGKKISDALQPRRRILPWLALNEVFIGEFLAVRPITLHLQVEDQEGYVFRSSGICVCTGTGSRSWYRSMNVKPADTVQSIVEMATGKKLTIEETNKLLYKYRQSLLYPAEDLRMTYMIREMYRAPRCWRNKCYPDREMCNKITVKSYGFDAGLIIDGSISLPFNDGASASFDIKPEYALMNIIMT
ncbi:NAD kinase 2, mitochondrial isoform X1 [Osmia lignaria lignaria]|uniref:NAD kinase 2, mitochondrial isoform X1 n=1 Tax=Osmia lignaria lignaria TaxID=1437193 RepID=UPI00402BB43F